MIAKQIFMYFWQELWEDVSSLAQNCSSSWVYIWSSVYENFSNV